MTAYIRDGAEIYRRSFATIRSEAELDGLEPVLERTVVRMIHASGMVDLAADVAASPGFGPAAAAALRAGAPIFCDTSMVAAGITRARLPAANDVVCTLTDPRVAALAARARHDPHRRRDRALARAPGGLARRRRQRADRALPAAGDPRGGRRSGGPRGGHRRARSGSSARRSRRSRSPSIPPSPSTSSCTAAAAAARSPRRPSTRSRARPSEQLRHRRAGRPAVRRRRRARRPRAADAQGAARHRVGARRRVPERAPRAQRRAADRLGLPARGRRRGRADVPRHDGGLRPPGRLRGRDLASSTTRRRRSSPSTSTPAATSPSCARATRSSTAPTCTSTSGSPRATRPRSSPA